MRNTLKITSAMKLVSSAKLRKAQKAIENMRPYEEQLQGILSSLGGAAGTKSADFVREDDEKGLTGTKPRVFVAIASNSSLCGGFNAAAVAKVRELRREGDVVYSVGRKMAEAMRRDGFPSPEDLNDLAEHPAFARVADLVETLSKQWEAGKFAQVLLVYNHFVSTARQEPVAELLLDAESSAQLPQEDAVIPSDSEESSDVIIEPSRKELLKVLLPKTRKLKLYAALLDSSAAEHAARTVAMQTATDNGENLLQELTLQYNKGRQQKITSEILDLAGGQAAE